MGMIVAIAVVGYLVIAVLVARYFAKSGDDLMDGITGFLWGPLLPFAIILGFLGLIGWLGNERWRREGPVR